MPPSESGEGLPRETSALPFILMLACAMRDLRLPLQKIAEAAETLRIAPLPGEYRVLPEQLYEDACRLLDKFNELADLARLGTGAIPLLHLPFDLELAAAETCDALAPLAAAKGLDFVFSVAPGLPVAAVGDADRVRRILNDLCESAIRDTESGSVSFALDLAPSHPSNLRLRGTLRDSSAGVPANRPCACLLPCRQNIGCPEISAEVRMTVAKGLVERLGGAIEASLSAAGRTILFEIPLHCEPQTAPRHPLPFEFSGMTAMLAGSAALRGALEPHLAALGFQTVAMSSSDEAMQALSADAQPPDTVLVHTLDARWAEFGPWLAQKWKGRPRLAAISPPGAAPMPARLRDAGYAACLPAAITSSSVRELILRLFGAPGAGPLRDTAALQTDRPLVRNGAAYDRRAALERCGGDEQMLAQLAAEARRQLQRISMEIRSAVGRQDRREALRLLREARQETDVLCAAPLAGALDALEGAVANWDWSRGDELLFAVRINTLRLLQQLPAMEGE